MRIAETKAALLERMNALLAAPGTLPKVPYPYQLETITKFRDWLASGGKSRRCHFAHATGLGKTVVFSSIIGRCVGLRALVIVPRKVLVEQIARELAVYTGGMIGHLSSLTTITNEVGEAVAVRGHDHHDVVVTTDASFLRHADTLVHEFDPHLIIRDECHNGYTTEEQNALKRFGGAVILACTATPDYLTTVRRPRYEEVTLENGRVLYGDPAQFARTHFDTCIDERSARWGIEEGWLAPLAWGLIDFDISLDGVKTVETEAGRDYSPEDLAHLMRKHWTVMCDTVAGLYSAGEYDLPNRQAFAVCGTVYEAEELAERIRKLGVSAACITGNTTPKKRNAILRAYADRRIQLLTSVMVLREGWDAPGAEVCLMLRPTKSRTLYMQVMGRVLRRLLDGGFKVALVLDAHFQNTAFNPLSAPSLFKAPGEEVISGGILCGPRKPLDGGYGGLTDPSPYLPKNATPRIHVVSAFDIEHWANKEGTFEADGEVWGTQEYCAKELRSDPRTFLKKIEGRVVRRRVARSCRKGSQITVYALSDVRTVCADLVEATDLLDADGMFTDAEGVVWASAAALAQLFRMSGPGIQYRLEGIAVRARMCRQASGPVLCYALSDVIAGCADLVAATDTLDADGMFTDAEGVVWASVEAIAQKSSASVSGLSSRMKGDGAIRRRFARGRQGSRVVTVYALSDVRTVCADLVEATDLLDAVGMFTDAEGVVWASMTHVCSLLKLSNSSVRGRLDGEDIRMRMCRQASGPVLCYALSDVKAVYADLVAATDTLDIDGTFTDAEGVVWAAQSVLAKECGASESTIRNWIAKGGTTFRKRSVRSGNRAIVVTVYVLKDVKTFARQSHGG